ncbi:hypothetical protein [Pseudoxanthomonas winnipegensis]|uniref:Uncharacterized protein n=1 Tax=Pseudoxanthomonas winnipegensis TaxID=2480810 RepID=A0A4Q8LZ12_9GAMM|nr:hypothetical protein [Pseudoxanthomonas winnipegensis]RZZ87042.1 hypothetical protein EA663_09260 [Pseudoxanthomonas winnipegensis]TAA37742.1 hypothetical protein EA656_03530 [Pseudoxanthomonas winnipegensis]
MVFEKISESLFADLWDIAQPKEEDIFPGVKPKLAHYTTSQTLDAIMSGRELWMSHPRLMNDIEELELGLRAGEKVIAGSARLQKVCGSQKEHAAFVRAYYRHADAARMDPSQFSYISCFCCHGPDDNDGLLSMWRAYGATAGVRLSSLTQQR